LEYLSNDDTPDKTQANSDDDEEREYPQAVFIKINQPVEYFILFGRRRTGHR
jgi:hypothetical protein